MREVAVWAAGSYTQSWRRGGSGTDAGASARRRVVDSPRRGRWIDHSTAPWAGRRLAVLVEGGEDRRVDPGVGTAHGAARTAAAASSARRRSSTRRACSSRWSGRSTVGCVADRRSAGLAMLSECPRPRRSASRTTSAAAASSSSARASSPSMPSTSSPWRPSHGRPGSRRPCSTTPSRASATLFGALNAAGAGELLAGA